MADATCRSIPFPLSLSVSPFPLQNVAQAREVPEGEGTCHLCAASCITHRLSHHTLLLERLRFSEPQRTAGNPKIKPTDRHPTGLLCLCQIEYRGRILSRDDPKPHLHMTSRRLNLTLAEKTFPLNSLIVALPSYPRTKPHVTQSPGVRH